MLANSQSEHVFDWTVENFSMIINKKRMYSDAFSARTLHETTWRAFMYPRGSDKDPDGIIVGLERNKSSDKGPEKIELKCELFLIAADGSETPCKFFFTGSIKKGDRCFKQMVKRDYIFSNQFTFLPVDMLTLRFKMTQQIVPQFTQIVATTDVRSEAIDFVWTISDLSCSCKYDFQFCKVLDKSVHMEMVFDPQTAGEGNTSETKIVVRVVDDGTSFHMFGSISVMDSMDRPRLTEDGQNVFLENEERKWSFPSFLDLDKFREKKEEFLHGDKLRLKCLFLFFEQGQETKMGERLMLLGSVERDLCYDMQIVNRCCWYPDVKLRTDDGHTQPAHRWVLASRCQVFLSMFEMSALDNVLGQAGNGDVEMDIRGANEVTTTTREMNVVKVSEVDRHTLGRLLHFLYTDKCCQMEFDDCLSLYSASVLFRIISLKAACHDFLKKNFNSRNVYGALLLADRTGESRLREAAQDFIAKRSNVILLTDNWQEFVEKEPALAKLVMCDLRVRHQEKCSEAFVI